MTDIATRVPLAELPNLFSDITTGVPSLNIPQYNWWSEALHGVSRCAYDRTTPADGTPTLQHGGCCYKGTCPSSFPAGITTGASFNKTLFRAIGVAVGTEARVMSNMGQASLTFWTPNVNVFRDPRCVCAHVRACVRARMREGPFWRLMDRRDGVIRTRAVCAWRTVRGGSAGWREEVG